MVAILALLAILAVLGALLLKWAWGALAVGAFGAPPLTFWQAFAAMVLLQLVGGAFRSSRAKR